MATPPLKAGTTRLSVSTRLHLPRTNKYVFWRSGHQPPAGDHVHIWNRRPPGMVRRLVFFTSDETARCLLSQGSPIGRVCTLVQGISARLDSTPEISLVYAEKALRDLIHLQRSDFQGRVKFDRSADWSQACAACLGLRGVRGGRDEACACPACLPLRSGTGP